MQKIIDIFFFANVDGIDRQKDAKWNNSNNNKIYL